ncbi:MAG TPA: putative peptidoglycan glycosyltransferase FtsW [Promineifilum sp.]|nr:putative peptidoglycan glycosyltransferase FtsW [Promineifilum sp.]
MAPINVVKRRGEPLLAGRNKYNVDVWLLLGTAALLVFGFLMVYSTTFDLGFRFKDNPVYYMTRQLGAMALGTAIIAIMMQFDYHALRILSVPIIVVTIVLLVFLLFFGQVNYGAARALSQGSYQPSELAKLATILYIAHWLHSKGDRIKQVNYGLLPFSIITGVMFALIVLQPALSTAILVGLISFTLFFVAGADLKQVLVVGLVAGGVVLLMMTILPHAAQRVSDFRAALADPFKASYQVRQALAALAQGGLFGVGLGQGVQKFGPLPLAHTDGVFAIVGEELGLVGALGLIALFCFLAYRGFRVATRARDTYGFLLAVGVTVWIAYQALINLAVITSTIPFTGMPMPFLSYGGSSMLITLIGVGILLNVSRDGKAAAALGGRQPRRQQPE